MAVIRREKQKWTESEGRRETRDRDSTRFEDLSEQWEENWLFIYFIYLLTCLFFFCSFMYVFYAWKCRKAERFSDIASQGVSLIPTTVHIAQVATQAPPFLPRLSSRSYFSKLLAIALSLCSLVVITQNTRKKSSNEKLHEFFGWDHGKDPGERRAAKYASLVLGTWFAMLQD